MAIYHLEGKIISRSQGRSAVAASAYRSAERLVDERTGLTHDFTKKEHDLVHSEILLPDNAPKWMEDRETLWNHVEATEKRKDAQLAREFNIALPRELSEEQNIALARAFVQKEFVDKGMVADLCLHRGHKGGEEQPHMHVMLSLREATPDGFDKKVREWNDKNLIHHWREAWSLHCNHHLALHGHDIQIDHRTLEAQGINLEPQTKIGAKAAQARMARLEEHQRIARENGERILNDPSIALNAVTHQQSTFTHQDLARFVNRHTEGSEQFNQVYEVVKASPELVPLGQDPKGRDRFTTRDMLALESKFIEQAQDKQQRHQHGVGSHAKQRACDLRTLSSEQQHAFEHVVDTGDIACVIGYAGTGKSYMLGAAREAWEREGYNVHGMTLSGIAAENLESGSGIKSHTIANRLINWENERERLTSKDIVVIDEAGMVGSRQMAKVMDEATRTNAKVVLVGDPEQLQAIEAGASFRAVAERVGYVEMTEIRRQQLPWQQEATKQLALGHTGDALSAYASHDHVHAFNTKEAAKAAIIEQWQETRSNEPDKSQIILAYTRDDVRGLNERAREVRQSNGELGQDYRVETAKGERDFAQGDRIYFLRNEKNLGVKNGTLGTIEKIDGKHLSVRLDKTPNEPVKEVCFHVSDYNDIDHGYAATVHKSQGVTVDRSYILTSSYFDRHTAYVALSRHRESAEVYWSREQFKDFSALSQNLGRERPKDFTLDYARHRDIHQNQSLVKTHDVSMEISMQSAEDRLIAAEKRLADREQTKALQTEAKELEKKVGRDISFHVKEGDVGIYRGSVELAGQRYGIMEQEKEIKLINYDQCRGLSQGEKFTLERGNNSKGQELLQSKSLSHNKGKGRGMDIDF